MSETQKHQINELMKEQMRLTENLAIQKDKARLAANSVLWELPGFIVFVLLLVVTSYILTMLSMRAAVPTVDATVKTLGPIRPSAYGPFSATQVGVALYYPSLYSILNALAVFADQLSPTGAEFMVKATQFILHQSTVGVNKGATLTPFGYAGDLERIIGSVDIAADRLYAVWYGNDNYGINAGQEISTSGDPSKAQTDAWQVWMGLNFRWMAPNIACLVTNPLLRCGNVFTPLSKGTQADPDKTKADARAYMLNSGPWMAILSHGLCGYAILEQDGTPDDMFSNVFGGKTQTNGQPYPCANVKASQMIQWGTIFAGGAGTLSMLVLHPVMHMAEHTVTGGAIVALLTLGLIAGGAAGGAAYGKSRVPAQCQ